MHTPTQLVPTGTHSAFAAGARRPRECRTYRRPRVRELPLRLEPVAPDTFGGLVNNRSLMTFIRNRRAVAAIVAATCVALPASASASAGALPPTYKSDAAQSGAAGSPPSTDRSDAAQSEGAAKSTFPPAGFRGGDTPVDYPGASRAATSAPTTIEVVRPERTIVRDVDEALPLILSSTALLLVLAGACITLVRTRVVPRPSRSH